MSLRLLASAALLLAALPACTAEETSPVRAEYDAWIAGLPTARPAFSTTYDYVIDFAMEVRGGSDAGAISGDLRLAGGAACFAIALSPCPGPDGDWDWGPFCRGIARACCCPW